MFKSYGFIKCLPELKVPVREFGTPFSKEKDLLQNGDKVEILVTQDTPNYYQIKTQKRKIGYVPKSLIYFEE